MIFFSRGNYYLIFATVFTLLLAKKNFRNILKRRPSVCQQKQTLFKAYAKKIFFPIFDIIKEVFQHYNV